jgi:hypothetical protein
VWCGFVGSGYASMVSLRLTSRAMDIRPVAILVAAVFRVWAIVAERGRRAADLAAAIVRVSDLQTGAEIGLHVGGDHCAQLVISARADQQSGALPTLEGPAWLCEARWCDCAVKCPSPRCDCGKQIPWPLAGRENASELEGPVLRASSQTWIVAALGCDGPFLAIPPAKAAIDGGMVR